jgi:hypothetical protein
MEYFTTFDNVFFALCVYYVATTALGFGVQHASRRAPPEMFMTFVYFGWTMNVLWLVVLGVAGYFSLSGMMTFMAVCTAIGAVIGVAMWIKNQHDVRSLSIDNYDPALEAHMVRVPARTEQ